MSWTDWNRIEVRDVAGERGVFARVAIPEGTVVGLFDGQAEVFDVDENGVVDWRDWDGSMSIHIRIANGKLFTIMPHRDKNISGIDFINHSCRPNCAVDASRLVVVTTQPIDPNEHLTLDYNRMDLVRMGKLCWCPDVELEHRCIL